MTARAALEIDIAFEADDWPDPVALEARARQMLGLAWARSGSQTPSDVALLFASDERVQALNLTFRQQDKPTNVLSFPAGGPVSPLSPQPGLQPLGDIVLACETTLAEAGSGARSVEAHMAHLVVHGFLHLLGYDHQDDSQAELMEAEETLIMLEAGFDDPYRLNENV